MMKADRSDPGLLDAGLAGRLDLPGHLQAQYRTALAEVPELTGPAADDPHERELLRRDDSPAAPLIDRKAVAARIDAPLDGHADMGVRTQLERVLDVDAWLRDYDVELDLR
jgi:hypothetical protein